ncbi:nucleotidyltransferase domain-containing protein [Flavobacterium sp. PL02]|uniref:nucleotidyltransferase domain-containing protein n=1 Tax=Flavobacterium sp. PL02 TaxID=3088354 RepID=UPI002B2291B7|nr:nucleotidyltransferase domain-containing protein [Flavobacterium sp. PL02]MEA9414299.1 nucleotidyltransferase domain-containing protein [Flavobacterium sp. PL02]
MHLYIFGSFCRGEIDQYSDIDLLIIKTKNEKTTAYDLNKYSIYNQDRIQDLWKEGNPFAWHLYKESNLVSSDDDTDFLKQLDEPNIYSNMENDLKKFYKLFKDSCDSVAKSKDSIDFDYSMIFLAIRNFASCYSLGHLKEYNFSRNSSLKLNDDSLIISDNCYSILEKSRILSTRGIGNNLIEEEYQLVLSELNIVENWFNKLIRKTINE